MFGNYEPDELMTKDKQVVGTLSLRFGVEKKKIVLWLSASAQGREMSPGSDIDSII